MVGHENTNSSYALRAIRVAGVLQLRMVPENQDQINQRPEDAIRREGIVMGNSQPQNHFDTGDNSDGSYEGFSMDDSSEEPFGIFLGRAHEVEHSNASMRRREKREDIPKDIPKDISPLDHEVAHITKLSTAPNGMLSRVYKKNQKGCISTFSMLEGREANVSGRGKFSAADCCHVASRYMPTGGPVQVEKLNSRAYVGQFSIDGSLFVAGFQDRHIKIYNVDKGWKVQKNVSARSLRWTVTDSALSPDQRYLVYASITPVVHIVNVGSSGTESVANITEIHEGLDFSIDATGDYSFGLFSVKFSTDGRELVAGSSDKSIYVYDLQANKLALQLEAHKDDVNTVAFADETGHLIYSGSDDNCCKVWDRRCLTSRARPAGTLVGHLEGITFIDSRGDGRYFISNGKDQTTKLWDIRKMSSGNSTLKSKRVPRFRWDYRWMEYPGNGKDVKHPSDQSLMTYRGHAVLRTLVRCYFSPVFSTAQKYIYTGSHDGSVYIYDVVTGHQVAKLEYHSSTVRDCSWHPVYPTLVSSSWDGVVARWEHPTGDEREPGISRVCKQEDAFYDSHI